MARTQFQLALLHPGLRTPTHLQYEDRSYSQLSNLFDLYFIIIRESFAQNRSEMTSTAGTLVLIKQKGCN